MRMMKAAVLKGPKRLEVESVSYPILNSGEVMVEVYACGVCGSDIRYFKGENPWALQTLGLKKENPPNIILGHEIAGEVVEVSDASLEKWKGKRVAIAPYEPCGNCRFCKKGQHNLCQAAIHLGHGAGWGEREYYPGGMAEFCSVWADRCYPLPESISYEEAAPLDIVGVAVHAVNVSQMKSGQDVLVIGCGPLGNSIIQVTRVYGARRIFCTDIFPKALETASQVGVDETMNTNRDDPVQTVLKKTNDFGVEAMFDTVGTPEVQAQALQMLAPGGTLVNMVVNREEISLTLLKLSSERVIRSSSNYLFPEFQIALDLLAAGKIQTKPLITHRFPISEINQAFEVLGDRQKYQTLKLIILP